MKFKYYLNFIGVLALTALAAACGKTSQHPDQKSSHQSDKKKISEEEADLISIDLDQFPSDLDHYTILVSQLIRDQKDIVVPAKLYHLGDRQKMRENVAARTVPKDVWDDFIMGDKTTYDLRPYRRGFYGTIRLKGNTYENRHGETGMNEIHIKNECRLPSHVVSVVGLSKDDRFKAWFNSTSRPEFSSIDQFKKSCFEKSGLTKNPEFQTFFPMGPESPCETIVNQFLTETHAKIVLDEANVHSFYIRDPSCIQNISGTPDESLQMFIDQDFWTTIPSTTEISPIPMKILLAIVKNTPTEIDLRIAQRLRSKLDNEANHPRTSASLKNLVSLGVALLNSFERCHLKRQLSELNRIDIGHTLVDFSGLDLLCP